MRRLTKISAVLGLALMVSSCATVLRKDKAQRINFDPAQKNTMVFVNGEFIGMSPVEMDVDASKDYEVTYLKKSYVSETFTLKNGVIAKWLIADLVCLPVTAVVPVIVDATTGAWKGVKTNNMPKSLRLWSEIENPTDYVNDLFQLENLYFEIGKDIIKDEAKDNLDDLAGVLNNFPEIKLVIHGHTDKTGDHDSNVKLSKDRAEAVKKYLTDKGVDGSRISTQGHGPDNPLVDGDSEDAHKFNRRVEFEYKV